ncbi:MAG: 2-C-methyl-D-erythritol 4-phosphate cytidylyltransferase [Lachnospiraceae bacterium]|nr:2-C-methyl-D-erythritol 4-phosphate cytidylyltransferase [Lachnospiraceae bacterium]
MSKVTAIVLAAGKGSRMKSDTPKQFLKVNGKPLIAYSLAAFEKSQVSEIVLVTGEDGIDICSQIVRSYHISKCSSIVTGGTVRALSVYNGIKAATGDFVLIHDGARPLVSQRLIADTIEAVKKYPAVVPVLPVKDTIRQIQPDGSLNDAFDRSTLFGMQTPQAFSRDRILSAYQDLMDADCDFSQITDDVMIMEKAFGIHAQPVTGEEINKKITTPEDMAWLGSLL